MRIELLSEQMERDLYEFEFSNRMYFEQLVPGRGDEFYNRPCFQERLHELLKEQRNGLCYMHVILNEQLEIIGRINLVNVNHEANSAELGYRIGEKSAGKGYASKALALLLRKAVKTYQFYEIKASTDHDNIASQRVLQKNGFRLVSTEAGKVELCEVKKDFLHFFWKSSIMTEMDGE